MRIIKSLVLNRDQELCRRISSQNLNQWLKICKRSYTKETVNNQKVQKFVPALHENLSVKNASKLSVKYLEDKIFKIKIIQNIPVTLRTFLTLICIKWIPRDPSSIFLATIFAQNIPESSGSMYSSILILVDIYYNFTWCGPNSQEIVKMYQFILGPRGSTNGTKFTIFCEFGPLQAKWCHVFWHVIGAIHRIWASCHYSGKSSSQKYTACVPGDSTPSCFWNVMSLFEETYKVSEPNCYT